MVNVVASVNVREMIADQDVDVVRAVPLPPVADHKGATLISPPHATVKKLFDLLGTATEVHYLSNSQDLRLSSAYLFS